MLMRGPRCYAVFGLDERMPAAPSGESYPAILSNDGFAVTAEEANILARIARNLVAIQRSLPEENKVAGITSGKPSMDREDVVKALMLGMHGIRDNGDPWPVKVREDFVDKFEAFAEWAPRSGGFRIH